MAIVQPLDLWSIFVDNLAGYEQQYNIFLFLSILILALAAARFKMTAMGLSLMGLIFSVIMFNATAHSGGFTIMMIAFGSMFVFLIISAYRDKLQ